MEIILASQSPRRRQLLAQLGLRFDVRPADVDETFDPKLRPEENVARLAEKKALAAAAAANPEDIVVAADTIVVSGRHILGKPADGADAARMLRLLSGRAHRVLTGVTVRASGRTDTRVVTTRLRFRSLSDGEIAAYIATGEPMDKAGAYGIQGLAAVFVEGLTGDYFNVMGLPLCTLADMLRRAGIPILDTL